MESATILTPPSIGLSGTPDLNSYFVILFSASIELYIPFFHITLPIFERATQSKIKYIIDIYLKM